MNEAFSDFKYLMLDASSVLHTHALQLMNEPQSKERDSRIEKTVRKSIEIFKRIREENPTAEHSSRLVRLYDLASIVMTEVPDSESPEYALMLVEKADTLSKVAGEEDNAFASYRQALEILGYNPDDETFNGALENAREVPALLLRQGAVLMARDIAGSNHLEEALGCFNQSSRFADSRLLRAGVMDISAMDVFSHLDGSDKTDVFSHLNISSVALEQEATVLQNVNKPKDALQKLEEALARRVYMVGPTGAGVNKTLGHLSAILEKMEESAENSIYLSACSFRIYQILRQVRSSKLFLNKPQVRDVSSIEDLAAGMDSAVAAISQWGAAALRAQLAAEIIKRPPVTTQVSGEGDADTEKLRNPSSSAVARAMRALGLVDQSINSLLSSAKSHRNHAGVARQTMLALLQFMDCAGPVLDETIQADAVSTILILLDLHRGDVNVKEPALQNLCKVFQLNDAGVVAFCVFVSGVLSFHQMIPPEERS